MNEYSLLILLNSNNKNREYKVESETTFENHTYTLLILERAEEKA